MLQPAADALKMIFKEDIIPSAASKLLYVAAPAVMLVPALMTLIVIPYGSEIKLFGYVIPIRHQNECGLLYVLGLHRGHLRNSAGRLGVE